MRRGPTSRFAHLGAFVPHDERRRRNDPEAICNFWTPRTSGWAVKYLMNAPAADPMGKAKLPPEDNLVDDEKDHQSCSNYDKFARACNQQLSHSPHPQQLPPSNEL